MIKAFISIRGNRSDLLSYKVALEIIAKCVVKAIAPTGSPIESPLIQAFISNGKYDPKPDAVDAKNNA